MNNNIMLITNTLEKHPSGGRQLLCKLNHDTLKEMYGESLILFELPRRRLQGVKSILNAFRGHFDGVDDDAVVNLLKTIQSENVDKVFVDGSNLGGIVKVIKQKLPQVEVSTFFHNVEARFFMGSFRQKIGFRSLAVLLVNYLAERKSVEYSDKIICLSERDSLLLQRVYGSSASHISPMAMQDILPIDFAKNHAPSLEKFALFVGGTFYANRAGISWFVKHIAPHIRIKIYIVGKGFEEFKDELEIKGKVEVVGGVESLAQWYLDAHFVIAPIFDGSGMKTKVAEALMFGKKIIGTPEAFSGYEDIADRVGRVCLSADDFVAAIETADEIVNCPFDPELRAIYEAVYSFEVAKLRLENIMSS